MARSDTGAEARPDPLIGKRIGSYEVLARVARGGMGVVYRARHIYIDKVVALKVLDPALSARPELIERFRTEAQSLARVEHENVIKVIDILEDQGVHCIVMDFAEGENLRQQVKKHGPLPADELLSVARQTAEALFAAHREGILHRDIKPENLIMNARGRCKLADFGLAGDMRLISEGHEGPLNFGTPAYSSPEVLRRITPDNRSDIFSYAATLYFLATGEPPFGQTGSQQILLKQKQGIQPLEQRRPDLPVKLTRVVMECLAWHPKERPETFREVLDRLPRRAYPRPMAGATEPTGLTTAETTSEIDAPAARWIVASAFGMAALALAMVGVVWWLNRDADDPEPVATTNRPEEPARPTRPPENANREADTPPVQPNRQAEEEAYNSAELDSRTALSRADYKAAWEALSTFMRNYPESELLDRATRQRAGVLNRVRELRDNEFRKAREAAEQALKDKRTEEAMATLDRFPAELLVPLSEDDHVAVATQLDTQRRLVEATDATDLAAMMKRADTLREDWERARNHPTGVSEQTRLDVAGNLLLERDLLEEFLKGRLKATRDKIETRLAGLRKLLESVHQDALEPVVAWRQFQDQTLGEWALWMSGRLQECTPLLRKRDFTGAAKIAREVGRELAARVGEFKPRDPRVGELARQSRILQNTLERVAEDLRLPQDAEALCESELRSLVGTGVVRDYHVHEQTDAAGERSARILRHSGRVVSAGNGEFRVETDSGRVNLRIDMLTVASFRKILSGVLRPDDRATVVAWCALQGRAEDASAELETLVAMEQASAETKRRARALCETMLPAPGALGTLRYLAAKSGLISSNGFEGMPEDALLTAQAGVNAGSAESARVYIGLVAQLADPELVHLATYERALSLANAGENHLRNRTILEPLSAEAWVAAAKALRETDLPQAKTCARKALLLDAASAEAWDIAR